jgi:hypothetical protein
VVAPLHPGDLHGDPVVDGRGAPLHEAVVAHRPPAGDQVEPGVELGQEAGDLLGLVLPVRVHEHHHVARGVPEADAQGMGLAEVLPQAQDMDGRVAAGELGQDLRRPVVAAVVDDHDLVGEVQLLEDLQRVGDDEPEVLGLVVRRHDHRHLSSHAPGLTYLAVRSALTRRRSRRSSG